MKTKRRFASKLERDRVGINAILSGARPEAAAVRMGVSLQTVYRRVMPVVRAERERQQGQPA